MKQLLSILAISVLTTLQLNAGNDDTLFLISGSPVHVSEFEYIYNKNNFNNKADYSEQSLKEYLDLFINFRLKVKEAEVIGLDKDPKLMSELKVYEEQLYNSFYDRTKLSGLVDEAIERAKHDLSISHIFVSAPFGASAEAMKNARKKIDEAYAALESGKSFDEVAVQYSEDENSKNAGGMLGYFTSLQIAFYPLENAAYNTPAGEYSKPIQTSLGYHIVKVNDKRPARGLIKVAIIKLLLKDGDKEYNDAARSKMNTIYTALSQGTEFAEMARLHSQDNSTKNRGGEMEWFGISKYDPIFEDKAFNLVQVGDYTIPFETGDGIYIVKLLDKKSGASKADRELFIKKVKQSDRYEMIRKAHIEEILEKYGQEMIEPGYSTFREEVIENLQSLQFNANDLDQTFPVINVAGTNFSNLQLGKYITANNFKYRRLPDDEKFDQLIEDFVGEKAIEFHIQQYGKENEEYGALLNEYRDGILLFDLMEDKVWSKAVQDTAGLRQYYRDNRDHFTYPERARVRVYEVEDQKQVDYLSKALEVNPELNDADWLSKLRKKGINTSYDEKVIYKEETSAASLKWEKYSQQVFDRNNTVAIWQVYDIEKDVQKSYEDARGFVIAEYQEYLEAEWVRELKSKYKVVINEDVLQSLVKP